MTRWTSPLLLVLGLVALTARPASAQYYQSDFPPEEFQARWQKVFERIGDTGVAVVQGMPTTDGFIYPRQNNTTYYLSGIEVPNAYLLLDGRTKQVTLYLPPRNEALERAEGRVYAADDVEALKRLIGVSDVKPLSAMAIPNWPIASSAPGAGPNRPAAGARQAGQPAGQPGGGGRPPAPIIYAEFAPAEGVEQSRGEMITADVARANDPWDGGVSRQRRFVELLRVRNPRAEIRDLTPILDELRSLKSPREIAVLRRASQLAGLGMIEAIRSTKPGVMEYQLEAAARYVFILNGARLEGYRSIIGSGTETINNMHYFRNNAAMKAGDLVLMDYAPDYHYYVSDIGRVWPVNGTYAPWQRELLQFVLEYRNAVMTRIRPGVTSDQIREEAKQAMAAVFAKTKFSKPIYEQAARRLVDTGGGVFSHTVGLAVHDVGNYRGPLQPGQVFSVDPQLRVPEEQLYLRYEDVVVVNDTGYENFTAFLPSELDALEKLAREKGMVQIYPPTTEEQVKARGAK